MQNCRKDTKEVYLSILGYDIAMYTNHSAELERGTWSSEQITHGASSRSGDVRHSQADIASIRDMHRKMIRLLTAFMETKSNMQTATNRWRIVHIAANGAMQSDTAGANRTDCIFRNMAPSVAFNTFIWFLQDAGQTTSVI